VVVESALAAVEAEVAAGGTIIKAMPGSRANHAGSFLVSWEAAGRRMLRAGTASKKTKEEL
jgi:hypothetical protein